MSDYEVTPIVPRKVAEDPRAAIRILEPNWQPGMTLDELEKRAILKAFRIYGGVQTATAQALGISVRTIRNKLVSYGMKGLKDDDGNELIDSGAGSGNAKSEGTGEQVSQTASGQAPSAGASPGVHLESASQVPGQHAVPVREQKEVQKVSQGPASAGNTRRGR